MTARGFLKTKYGNKPLGEIVANMTALQVEEAMEEYAEMVAKNCTIPHVIKSVYCDCENQTEYTDANGKTYCKWCGKDIKQ